MIKPEHLKTLLFLIPLYIMAFSHVFKETKVTINTDTSQEDKEIKILEDDNENKRRIIDSNTNYVNDVAKHGLDSLWELHNPK